MRFGVLGPLAVWDDEGKPVTVPETLVRALLADLLVHEGRPVSADRLIDDLWGDAPPGRPSGALQTKVSQLRRALGRDRVLHRPSGYLLRIDESSGGPGDAGHGTDVARFRFLVAAARDADGPQDRAALLTEALGLWRGPAYADFADEEFVRTTVHRLDEDRLTALEEQAEARLELGEYAALSGELADLVARHPLRERLRAVQLHALHLSGRQSEALASYAALRTRLADELGLDPSPALAALHQAILTRAPELGAGPPPEARPRSRAGRARLASNLPAQLTELVGRQQDLTEVCALLTAGRLVTLTGPGGVGKTRLALAAAAHLATPPEAPDRAAPAPAALFPDGVRLVELAGLTPRHGTGALAELAEVVAAALGVRDDSASSLPALGSPTTAADRLAAALRDRRLLLVLDNCEHLVGPVADLAALLLRTAPGLRVLATSQEPLGVPGETLHPVAPLQQGDAVALFAARAAATAPGFVLDASTAQAAEEICRRLDGIPLALELAATRVRALGVRELADRLGDRFRLLSGGGHRGAPPRQQTLRAMIDWSWELLTAPERIVLRRLAVHHDGCTPEAAEAVCAGDGVARDEVLDLLVRLVDRSLAVMVEGPQGPRYRLLESVAAYATERLHEMEDLTLVRQRHLAHYLELADRARPRLHGPDQSHWLHRLDAETGNLRAALDHAVAPRNSPGAYEAHRLVTSLSWYWLLRGRLREAHRALEAALRATPDGPGSPGRPAGPSRSDGPDGGTDPAAAEAYTLRNAFALLVGDPRPAPVERDIAATGRITDTGRRARAQWLLAHAHFNAGNVAASEQLTALALAGFRALDDRWGVGLALGSRAIHALIRGDLAVIRRDGEESVRTLRELGDRWGELQSVSPLAALAEISGDYARAARLHRDGLRLAEELGLTAEVSARLSGLGRLALLDRDWPRARELHEKARRLAVEQGYKFGEIYAELGLALGARREGDPVAAEAYLVRIRDWYAEVSSEAGNTLVLAELGFVAEQRGDHRAARALHLEALAVAHEVGDLRALALALEGLAGAEALAGRPAAAALLLGAATAAREAAGAPLPPAERGDVDRIGSAVRGAVGEAAFTEAFVRGRKLTPDEAAAATAGAGAGSAETR